LFWPWLDAWPQPWAGDCGRFWLEELSLPTMQCQYCMQFLAQGGRYGCWSTASAHWFVCCTPCRPMPNQKVTFQETGH